MSSIRSLLALLLVFATACGPSSDTPELGDDGAGGEDDEAPAPNLPRSGLIVAGEYLFDGGALGTGDALHPAQLVSVEPDSFTVMVDGSPHRSIARTAAWPMVCLTRAVEHTEGSLTVRWEAGAPVFVLVASRDGARISAALHSEHSIVVARSAYQTAECTPPAPAEAAGHVAPVGEGDVPCLFPDQETLDEGAGLPIPSGAPAERREESGAWVRARVSLRGGEVDGWMGASLYADGASATTPGWTAAAVGRARCVFPDRPEARPWEPTTGEVVDAPPPTIPAIEIERVMRNGEPQIRACYEARLSEVPDLTVQLEILMLVDADGRVADADVTRGATADAGLTRCALERVTRWRFPPPRTGAVNVRHTFDLRPPR